MREEGSKGGQGPPLLAAEKGQLVQLPVQSFLILSHITRIRQLYSVFTG